ncbi:MAG TPA: hypothetical protein VGO73_00270 [Pyrinomonadaceae bacterium]|jgi:hypothetical protein|nr:hypothetical protein [Pyrinomonadaceae bacterium]
MDTGGLVSEGTLTSDRLGMQMETQSAGSRNSFTSAGTTAAHGLLSADQNANKPGDLRSIVASRFMRMLRSHDRVRSKLLAAR